MKASKRIGIAAEDIIMFTNMDNHTEVMDKMKQQMNEIKNCCK